MGHDEAFLRDIIEHPDDDAPRLIYADWLQDHDQAERAEFIRLQCRLAAPDALDDPHRWALLARQQQLLREHGKGWAGPLRRLVKRWRFRRGFVESVVLPAEAFLRHGDELFRLAPIREVRLLGESIVIEGRPQGRLQSLESILPDVLESPHLARLRGLDLSDQFFDPLVFEMLIGSQHFPRLESLNLSGTPICSDDGFHQLASMEELEGLRELSLSNRRNDFDPESVGGFRHRFGISGEAMGALAHSPHLRNVTRLRLGCSTYDLTAEAVEVLAASPLLEQLTELSTSYPAAPYSDLDNLLEALLSSKGVARLQVLRLRRSLAHELPLDGLFNSPHLANLRCLDLSNCMPEDARPVAGLADAGHLANLRELNLSGCKIGDEGMHDLCRAKGLPKLAALNLDRDFFSAEAVRAFAGSPLLGRLRWLSMQGPGMPVVRRSGERERRGHRERRVGDGIAAAFASSAQAAGLVYLDLGNQRLTDAGLSALAGSSHLANLMTLRLWNNEIGEGVLWNAADPLRSGGVSALVLSEHLQRLVTVDLRSNPLPRAARLALRQRFGYGVCYGRGPLPQAANILPDEDE